MILIRHTFSHTVHRTDIAQRQMKFITAPKPEPEAPANFRFNWGQVDCALQAHFHCGHL